MTDTLVERYRQLFTAFYDVDAEPPVPPANRARFLAERSRRILDIARLLHTGWPRTTALAQAHAGDQLVHAVACGIPLLAEHAGSISDAIETGLTGWLAGRELPLLQWVFAFEQLSRGRDGIARPASAEERALLPVPPAAPAWVLAAPFDLPRAIRAVDFLLARSATSALLREVVPLGGPGTVTAYRDGSGRIRVLAG
ncbi:hypothetical protein [Jatrophihabitans sp.]|uniref:hypothetical protein n=1 Tax=Jatrophihabitans sp. TaxID=1932789 RepID=UPI002D089B76|nr:hypothetical protein [Jatrophihabitans sp.]